MRFKSGPSIHKLTIYTKINLNIIPFLLIYFVHTLFMRVTYYLHVTTCFIDELYKYKTFKKYDIFVQILSIILNLEKQAMACP